MFGNRSILPDPPIINSGDYRLKYKSVQELIDSAAVSDKIYKYPVNDMTGTYQRSMTSAKFGASSVASSSSISKASTLSGLRTSSMVPVLQNQKIPKYSSKHSPIIPKPTSTRCLINNFNSEKSTASDNEYSLSMDDYVTQGNVLKKARNNQMELKQCVAGPISYLPPRRAMVQYDYTARFT
ncbi:hypothetical protein C1645_756255 [Glomus cerebriforme]|uniref:Uncharacterized protein n=1 Tax=Glomus cerebriforme TaxID=658196 RepID=A0A397TM03_9GLOM|nr:hypothetical protein C1645_756255 [Glomus cerebriforme]